MRIKKYDHGFSRRTFLEKTAKGAFAGGVLAPLWPSIAKSGLIDKVYPDELLSIELYTKGKIKPGTVLNPDNVEHVKDLLDPIAYNQVKTMGRQITIVETTKDVSKLFPHEFFEATLRNEGKAKLDADQNTYTNDGSPWIGGLPFPQPKDGVEVISNLSLSWGRHDESVYAARDWDIGPDGTPSYQYDLLWAEQATTGLVNQPSPYWAGHEDKLRYQSVFFTAPQDAKGTAYLNTWYYDQRKFPDLVGYLPAFKRVRRFPTNQRFEPLVPGITFFLSDAWAAGDPYLTWGNYKVIETKPFLGSVSNCWAGKKPNWEKGFHGGPKGLSFLNDDYKELCPEVMVIDAEPTGYPRAPVGKKRIWVDLRNSMFVAYISYDRRGEAWRSFEAGFSQYVDGDKVEMDGKHPLWSWTHVQAMDIQTNRTTMFTHVEEIAGGYRNEYNTGPEVHERYLTPQAIRRFGT